MKIRIDELYCNIITNVDGVQTTNICFNHYPKQRTKHYEYVVCKLIDTPHYKYLTSNRKSTEYKSYSLTTGIYAGFGLEHSISTYNTLIDTFRYNDTHDIKCIRKNNKIILTDGVHRSSLLFHKYGGDYEVHVQCK